MISQRFVKDTDSTTVGAAIALRMPVLKNLPNHERPGALVYNADIPKFFSESQNIWLPLAVGSGSQTPAVTGVANIGTAVGSLDIFKQFDPLQPTEKVAELHRIAPGTNVTISYVSDSIVIDAFAGPVIPTTLSDAGLAAGHQSLVANGVGPALSNKGIVGNVNNISFASTANDVYATLNDIQLNGNATQTANASGANASALGRNSTASGIATTAIGPGTTAAGDQSSVFGNGSTAALSANSGLAMGTSALAEGVGSIAIGLLAGATGPALVHQIAIGRQSLASHDNTIAIGVSSVSSGPASVALGANASASSAAATALGQGTIASNTFSTAIGSIASATGDTSLAVGYGSNASANRANAIGTASAASGTNTVALGDAANASANYASSIGWFSSASGIESIAIGPQAASSAQSAITIGKQTVASAANTIAIGEGSSAAVANAVAIGTGQSNNTANSMVFGAVPFTPQLRLDPRQSVVQAPNPGPYVPLGLSVTLDAAQGVITVNTIPAAGNQWFTLFNNRIGVNSFVFITCGAGTTPSGAPLVGSVGNIAAGSVDIFINNQSSGSGVNFFPVYFWVLFPNVV